MNLIDAMLEINGGNTVRLRSFVYRKRSCASGCNVIEMKFVADDDIDGWTDFYLMSDEITSNEWRVVKKQEKESEDTKKECDCECMEKIKGLAAIFCKALGKIDDIEVDDYKYFIRELRLLGLVD